MASESLVEVDLPQSGAYSITPEPSSLRDKVGVFDIKEGQYLLSFKRRFSLLRCIAQRLPLNVSLRYAETAFQYRKSTMSTL